MSILTFLTAALAAGAAPAAMWLALCQRWDSVLDGVLLAAAGAVAAIAGPGIDGPLARRARVNLARGEHRMAYTQAGLHAGLRGALALGLGITSLLMLAERAEVASLRWIAWLWSYGVATAPLLLRASLFGRRERTLDRLHASAAQIGYMLLSLCILGLGLPLGLGIGLTLLPLAFPCIAGALLALAEDATLSAVLPDETTRHAARVRT